MVSAQQACRLSAVHVDLPLLILPMTGIKKVVRGEYHGVANPGQFLMIHHATCLQVENLPPASGEGYRAWLVTLPWRVVEIARTMLPAQAIPNVRDESSLFTIGVITPLLGMLQMLLDVLTEHGAPSMAAIDHALLGVALALARCGHGHFLHAHDLSLSARIRQLVAASPERKWISADFEERLHVSGATLRRRLAEEKTSLRESLRDARLHHALTLLQTTRKPVKSVALACGYRSAPSFTRNFTARFGTSPLTVANHP